MGKIGASIAGLSIVVGTGVAIEAGQSFVESLHPSNQETEYRQNIADLNAQIGALSTSSALRETMTEKRGEVNFDLAIERKQREQNQGNMAAATLIGIVFAVGGFAWEITQSRGAKGHRKFANPTRNSVSV